MRSVMKIHAVGVNNPALVFHRRNHVRRSAWQARVDIPADNVDKNALVIMNHDLSTLCRLDVSHSACRSID
jgi:hypothetical protein